MNHKILFFYACGVLLGILTGCLSALFQWSIGFLQNHLMLIQINWSMAGISSMVLVGMSYFLVQYDFKEAAGSGIQQIEGILKNEGVMHWRRLLPIKFWGGLFSIGAFMVLGREGPTVQMGAHLGRMLSERLKWEDRGTHLLIAAGSAAGLATAFNAPIAGILFLVEELRYQVNIHHMDMPIIMITTLCATLVLQSFIGIRPSIIVPSFEIPHYYSMGVFIIFGFILGFLGIGFNDVLIRLLKKTSHLSPIFKWLYVLLIGFLVGILALKLPLIVGSGELMIEKLLGLGFDLNLLVMLFFGRLLMTLLSFSTGLPGGVFSPILGIGTLIGFIIAKILNLIFPELMMDTGIFALAGMAGLFCASIQAPLTGIILIVEMTQNYALILPLMVTCLCANFIAQKFSSAPLYTQLLNMSKRV